MDKIDISHLMKYLNNQLLVASTNFMLATNEPAVSDVNWGDTPEGRRFRRYVTDKWGIYAFVMAVVLMILVVLANAIVSPVFYTLVNIKPSLLRQNTLNKPWSKIALWVLTAALLVTVFVQSNGLDPVFIVKRLGRLAVALMPPMYLLTLRPSPLPRTFYLHLVGMHKFLSRVVVLFSVVHGILYTWIYYHNGTLVKLNKLVNILGIAALAVFVTMALTGMHRFRRFAYEIFYQFHVIGAWSCLPMIRIHSRPGCDGYMLMCLVLLIFQVAARLWLSANAKLRVQFVSPTLLLVHIPKTSLPPSWWNWSVAAHLRLSGTLINPLNWVRSSHPYTIASLPDDDSVKLVIRKGNYGIQMRRKYSIFGPHACVPNYLQQQIRANLMRRVLLVIGGAGIAFGAPMMRYLRLYGAEVRMVWVMRDPYDARVLPQLGLHEEVLRGNIEIHYTGESLMSSNDDEIDEDESLTIGSYDQCCLTEGDGFNPVSSAAKHPGLASRRVRGDPMLSQYAPFMYNSRPHLNLRLKSWLYGYSTEVDDCCCADRVITSCASDRLGAWVMACGGEQLSDTAFRWSQDSGVCFFKDTFAL